MSPVCHPSPPLYFWNILTNSVFSTFHTGEISYTLTPSSISRSRAAWSAPTIGVKLNFNGSACRNPGHTGISGLFWNSDPLWGLYSMLHRSHWHCGCLSHRALLRGLSPFNGD
ncbi:hypothetical protein AMTRI_Chr02g264120 [Amborella trichopoda]